MVTSSYVPGKSPFRADPALRAFLERETQGIAQALRTLGRRNPMGVSLLDFRARGDGTTDDFAAINEWLNCGAKRLYAPAGSYLIGTNTALVVPSGVMIEGDWHETVFLKPAGNTDIFTTTGSNIAFRRFRMEGPDNTTVDGISTDGGSSILAEYLEGYQLASTFTAGLTTATERVLVRHTYSEDNAQQGVHFNKASIVSAYGNRGTGIGTSTLHHGMYVGDVTDGDFYGNFFWANAGAGIHDFAQTSFAKRRVRIHHNHLWQNTWGVLSARDATSSAFGIGIDHNTCRDNTTADYFIENIDELDFIGNYADGTANGWYFGATHSGIVCAWRISGGTTKNHSSNIRLPISAGCQADVWVDSANIVDADGIGAAGIFGDGAGTLNLDVCESVKFANNTTDIIFTPAAGTLSDRSV